MSSHAYDLNYSVRIIIAVGIITVNCSNAFAFDGKCFNPLVGAADLYR